MIARILLFTFVLLPNAFAIENFHEVSPGIYRGARPHLAGLEELGRLGVRTVINLQGGETELIQWDTILRWIMPGELPRAIRNERLAVEARGMKFLNFPMSAVLQVTPEREINVLAALDALVDPANHPVFIHCQFGNDRTGLIVALYRVFHQGWHPDQAHAEMVEKGHSGVTGTVITAAMDEYFFRKTGALFFSERLSPAHVGAELRRQAN